MYQLTWHLSPTMKALCGIVLEFGVNCPSGIGLLLLVMSQNLTTPPVCSSVVTAIVPAAFGQALCVKLDGVVLLLSAAHGYGVVASMMRMSPL